jgi:hypothetical protein
VSPAVGRVGARTGSGCRRWTWGEWTTLDEADSPGPSVPPSLSSPSKGRFLPSLSCHVATVLSACLPHFICTQPFLARADRPASKQPGFPEESRGKGLDTRSPGETPLPRQSSKKPSGTRSERNSRSADKVLATHLSLPQREAGV